MNGIAAVTAAVGEMVKCDVTRAHSALYLTWAVKAGSLLKHEVQVLLYVFKRCFHF